jgi:hypothetical protein
MDFVGGLTRTKQGNDDLLVVVDRFSKMCIFMPWKNTIKGQDAIIMFSEKVWVHFGIPKSIISNKDTIFFNSFWSTFRGKTDKLKT